MLNHLLQGTGILAAAGFWLWITAGCLKGLAATEHQRLVFAYELSHLRRS